MTYGTMAVDHEMRIDYDKLRKDRLQKTRDQMEKDGLGALLVYDPDNIRYITSTKLGEWSNNKLGRYALLPKGKDPILFEIGSAVPSRKALCPWLKDIRPAKTDMRGTMPPELGTIEYSINEIASILKEYGLEKEPIGVDVLTVPIVQALQKNGLVLVDGQQTMLNAQTIKTKEEIQCLEISAAMVDGAYWDVFNMIKPGIRENEVYAMMRKRLYELGAENVHNVNVISGDRANPHPHDFSDRIIRPGDMVFLDVVNDFNGYKTCYYRTFVCGRPTERQKRVYKKAYDWLYDAIKMIKPGVRTDEIAKLWPDYKQLGYDNEYETLALFIGHGVGVSHWAKPIISHQNSIDMPEVLQEGMHIALETYYGEEGDAARIEEQVVITKDGCKVITTFPANELLSTWNY
ncbi:Xaa-Pro dipeptidase [Paenibacillus sp. yr247]|uniref:M24 family metallopeptidase n=1 Tax=Paenibacillus sp. yr247 TaxID=1761880 RepID=UPI000881634E|nr:Xaa-Pro peptidase family protein [Paenibacillus sp. yr247]SDO48611.1 Xaa-Pro dipeptidase [Paenibacillus sp. yr247]